MAKKYYIVFETKNLQCWRIVDRDYNLDTLSGIKKEIEYLEKEFGSGVILLSWKTLKVSLKEVIQGWFS